MSCECENHQICIDNAIDNAEEICYKNGVKLTNLRKRVLKLVWAEHEPMKAYDLLAELQKEDRSAKPITIYRTLDFLLQHGLIHKIHRLNSYVGCSAPHKNRPCLFLICSKCHKVTESQDNEYYKLISNISKNNEFKPREANFEIEGLCSNCA